MSERNLPNPPLALINCFSGYLAHHRLTYPTKQTLQSSINTYLSSVTRLETLRDRMAARARNVPDADGFITVTRGSTRNKPVSADAAQAAAARAEEKGKGKAGPEFYRFQVRERRKERDRELKREFEDDVRRIREMKERKGKIRPE